MPAVNLSGGAQLKDDVQVGGCRLILRLPAYSTDEVLDGCCDYPD